MSFIGTLKRDELAMLRAIVKRVNFKHYPDEFVTDWEADKLIDTFGPDTVANLLDIGGRHGILDR